MPPSLGRLLTLALAVNLAQGCARATPSTGARSHSYIYAFAGDDDKRPGDSDFLAVIDADPASPTYARVLATAPIGAAGTMPHHTELTMPGNGQWLFANGFMSGRTFLFDLANPLAPRLAATLDSIPGFVKPHSYWRLPDGRLVATVQYGNGSRPGNPGGIALLASHGQVLETSSAADSAFPDAPIRTYSLDVSPVKDRIITTSTPMDGVPSADVVQVWRLSDMHLLRTLALPVTPGDSSFRYPFEVRFLPGDTTALLNTYYCGFYLLSDLNTSVPRIERVLSLPRPQSYGCAVPLLFGHYWIMPIGRAHEFLVLDIADPRHPRPADSLMTDSTFHPHWLTREPGSNRLVATSGRNDHRVLLARFDSTRGTISWDSTFRDPDTKRLGVDFDRAAWPHGATGAAMPHGAVFSASGVGTAR
ncbi:MAG TPA: hypothetical protein VFW66_03430 [Gemmatimonadales bacterium]|nr:hypothetical protein [Gemmatimonadales bacterium]